MLWFKFITSSQAVKENSLFPTASTALLPAGIPIEVRIQIKVPYLDTIFQVRTLIEGRSTPIGIPFMYSLLSLVLSVRDNCKLGDSCQIKRSPN